MATFEYFGLQYVTLEGTDNEVAVRSAPNKGRIIIPEYVENDGKRYVVTQVGHDSFRMTNKTEQIPGVRDNRMKDGWRVKPQYLESGSEPRGPFSPIYVAEDAYSNPAYSNIESVKMPASITKLWYGVFRKCRKLTSVDIPPKVTVIPDRAFSGCTSLEKIDIHEGIVSIGKLAFIGCTALKEVTIPSSVKSIDYSAFVHSKQSDCGVEVVNIYNDEGEVIIHPEAFAPNIKINYLGKKAASKEKTPKASQKQQTEESVTAPSIDLDKLINAVVADGVITDKERAVILKKATAAGYDADEVELLLDGKLAEKESKSQSVPETKVEAEVEPTPASPAEEKDDEDVDAAVDTDAMWADVVSKLGVVQNRITCPKGRPYISFASKTHKKNISYWAGYSPRGEFAWVCIETYGGEAAHDAIMAIVEKAPKGHICAKADMKQGARNKDKWALTVTTSIDKPTSELVEWYADNLLAFYKFFEDAKPF